MGSGLKDLIIKNKIFFIPYFLVSALVLYILLIFDKKTGHLVLTSVHNNFLDSFFTLLTHLGDGILVVITGIIFLVIRIRYGFLVILSYSLSGLFVQLLKKTVFEDFDRPFKYFEDTTPLHFVEGLNIHVYNSFPSGHATSAFALFFAICLISENKLMKFTTLVFASLVAYSRVYLSQHFLIDIWAGSVTGIAFTLFTWIILKNSKYNFLNKSLVKR